MTPAQLAIACVEARLVEWVEQLEAKRKDGENLWDDYASAAVALAAVAPLTAPGAEGRAMTTRELASAFGLTQKVARRKGLKGELPLLPIRLGPGPRAKLRWAPR